METQSLAADPGTFVVIGATGGIGSALTRRLVGHGDRVLAAGRDAVRLERLAAETGAKSFVLDARRPTDVRASLAAAMDHFGRLDGVANCVGSLLLKPAHLTSDEEFAPTIATNLGSAFGRYRPPPR